MPGWKAALKPVVILSKQGTFHKVVHEETQAGLAWIKRKRRNPF